MTVHTFNLHLASPLVALCPTGACIGVYGTLNVISLPLALAELASKCDDAPLLGNTA